MGLFNNFPYMDLSNLNLDFILREIRNLKDYQETASTAADSAEQSASAADLARQEAAQARNAAEQFAANAQTSARNAQSYAQHIADPVAGLVTSWLNENITNPTDPAIDKTLTIEGAAADAKAAGDKIKIYGAYGDGDNLLDTSLNTSGILNTNGGITENASFVTTWYLPALGAITMMFQAEESDIPTSTDTLYFFEYDASHTKLGSRQSFTIARGAKSAIFATSSVDCAYVRVSYVPARYTDVMIHDGSEVLPYEPYYVLKSEIAKAADLSAMESRVEECALLPTVYQDMELEAQQGNIRTNREVYNPSEDYAGRYVSIPVSPGDKYMVSGYSLNDYYPAVFVRTSTTVQTLLTGTNMSFTDEVITIPDTFDTLYVNGNIDYQLPVIKEPSRVSQDVFEQMISSEVSGSSAVYPLKCTLKNNVLFVKKKISEDRDLVISFGHVGGNSLFNFNSAFLLANEEDEPSNDFTGANAIASWSMSGSDWLAPYKVAAVNNANGDTPQNEYFTGGNHRTTNTASGGGVTAVEDSLEILVNGFKPIEDNTIYPCESVKVVWTNSVQAYNTSKADGTGRAVLTETWTMLIDNESIRLHNDIKALEAIDIKTYYGIQATNISGKKYRYVGGVTRTEQNGGTASDCGTLTCIQMNIWDSNFDMQMNVDPVDLGLFTFNNAGYAFFATTSKAYAYLISSALRVLAGEHLDFEGSYTFR